MNTFHTLLVCLESFLECLIPEQLRIINPRSLFIFYSFGISGILLSKILLGQRTWDALHVGFIAAAMLHYYRNIVGKEYVDGLKKITCSSRTVKSLQRFDRGGMNIKSNDK